MQSGSHLAPVEVTEHALVARICPVCQRRRLPKEALQGVVLGQQRLGVNLVSLMVTLREEGRLPIRIIQWYLETVPFVSAALGEASQEGRYSLGADPTEILQKAQAYESLGVGRLVISTNTRDGAKMLPLLEMLAERVLPAFG